VSICATSGYGSVTCDPVIPASSGAFVRGSHRTGVIPAGETIDTHEEGSTATFIELANVSILSYCQTHDLLEKAIGLRSSHLTFFPQRVELGVA
jgi:hypothetical protein